jgi:polyferredoxin
MNNKISQVISVWLMPLLIIGGSLFSLLGYLVFFMMIFLLSLSYFRARFWCWNLCPRGAFLDIVLSKLSLKHKLPGIFSNKRFKWTIFFLFMAIFILQLITVDKNIYSIGFVFVRMCLVTTLIAIIMGIPLMPRAWCAICPMGTLQTKINSFNSSPKSPEI